MRTALPRLNSLAALVAVATLFFIAPLFAKHQQAPTRQPQQRGQQARPAAQPPAATPAAAPAGPDYDAIFRGLSFRSIGPATMGGRIDDFAVVESNPDIVYVAAASGGLWKTTNAGTTWTPIFDDQPVSTIGDVTLAPSDPNIVWVGSGEANNRQSSSWGNGVYKSTDGGRTWSHMGLEKTQAIHRIAIHPRNPDVVYVAAVGSLWAPNPDRGLFKTTDGGKTWTKSLFINDDTGVTDVAMDPESPDTLYAAAYQRRRTVFGFNGSGPGSALYRTTDGGATWKKVTNGMPYDASFRTAPPVAGGGGPGGGGGGGAAAAAAAAATPQPQRTPPEAMNETGRIGIGIYRRNPNIVYALIEHADGGIFRSEDRGETWVRMSNTNPRPMYYSKVHIDPNNDLRIWALGAQMFYSEDGGRTFATNRGQRIHGDFHAMWINPADSGHMLAGSDGGIHWSWDSGRTWEFVNTIPLGQFYEINADMSRPYRVCGGLQDNNSWCGPSASMNPRGIDNGDWFTIGGGDGFFAQFDPNDPDIIYGESQDGNVLRRRFSTGESRSIRPQPGEGEKPYRFQWNTPIVPSVHTPGAIYYPGNFVFRSTDRGDSWTKISPDLTSGQDRNALPIMGRVPDRFTRSRHDGVQNWPTITSLSESAANKDVLWAGTDDGYLHVTRDGGKNWKNVYDKLPGVPKGLYVSRVIASRYADGAAYATIDGHRSGDFGIYVFMTADFGETWKDISSNLPRNNGIVNVIREHHKNPNLLFVGTEYGAFFSLDRGARWTKIKMGVPTVPVDDIYIHPRENDLIFGTHGRSIWILDDITSLEQMSDSVAAQDAQLFDVRPAISWRTWGNTGSTGFKVFLGPNPPNGAIINFYLKSAPSAETRMRINISDKDGKTIREIQCTTRPAAQADDPQAALVQAFLGIAPTTCRPSAGINRVVWDLRMTSPVPPAAPGQGGGGGGGGGGFGGGFGGAGSRVDPSTYTVKLIIGDKEQSKTVVVQEDPRVTISDADRAARRKFITDAGALAAPVILAQRGLQTLRTNLNTEIESWRRPGTPPVPENVRTAATDLLKKVDDLYPTFFAQLPGETTQLGDAGPPLVQRPTPLPNRFTQLLGQVETYTAAPTADQLELLRILSPKITEAAAAVRKLVMEDLPALNKLMNDAGLPHVVVPGAPGQQRGAPPRSDS